MIIQRPERRRLWDEATRLELDAPAVQALAEANVVNARVGDFYGKDD